VGLTRLDELLLKEELVDKRIKLEEDDKIAVQIDDLNFSWMANEGFGLKNFSMKVKKGEFVAIVGPVGSGKVKICINNH
jgi:ABC-type transport system involved in cytochrome bd biosynthesis fused ATPase/permease subunit